MEHAPVVSVSLFYQGVKRLDKRLNGFCGWFQVSVCPCVCLAGHVPGSRNVETLLVPL